MKRFFLMLAGAALTLALAACSLNPSSELVEADALYHTLPDTLSESELYHQAVNSGSVILYEGEPVTTSATAGTAGAAGPKRRFPGHLLLHRTGGGTELPAVPLPERGRRDRRIHQLFQ